MSAPRAMGAPVLRLEDPRLLVGGGRYVADVEPSGLLYLAIARSPVAHGRLRSVGLGPARAMDGVRLALDAAGLRELGLGELRVGEVLPGQRNTSNPALAEGKVRYVGQPVAAVLAGDPYLAEDAAAAVEIDIEPLPPVTDALEALDGGAPLLYEDWESNVVAEATIGGDDADRAFEDAEVVIRRRFRLHRHAGLPLESRGAVAEHDPVRGQTRAWVSTQSPHRVRSAIAQICGWPEGTLQLKACDTGGAFGTKEYPFTEELLTCALARWTGGAVKWVQDSREHFVSTVHAREQIWDVELAADRDGTLRALRGTLLYDVGGHCSANGIGPALQSAGMVPGPYRLPSYRMRVVGVVTNKTPAGAYRGYGVPQAAFVMERLVDELAREVGRDAIEVRRGNLIGESDQPYQTATGRRYDNGDYRRIFDRAVELIGADRLAGERGGSGPRRVGLGLAAFVMPTGLAPSHVLAAAGSDIGAYGNVRVAMHPDAKVTVFAGVCSQGQGTETMLAQVVAERLGLDPARDVVVVLGDTEMTPYDPAGSISSRITGIVGGAARLAAEELRDRLLRLVAHRLEVSEADVELRGGRAEVRGSSRIGVALADLAEAAHRGHDLPAGMEPGLETTATFEPENTMFSFGTHAVVVEVDGEETGGIAIRDYVAVHDSGTIVNPLLAEGQLAGAVAQGIGGALLEHLVYSAEGDPLVTSHMDYLMPTAADLPPVRMLFEESAAPHIPGGMKGVGEPGIVGPAAALANAVADALGCAVSELPLSPARVRVLASGSGE